MNVLLLDTFCPKPGEVTLPVNTSRPDMTSLYKAQCLVDSLAIGDWVIVWFRASYDKD